MQSSKRHSITFLEKFKSKSNHRQEVVARKSGAVPVEDDYDAQEKLGADIAYFSEEKYQSSHKSVDQYKEFEAATRPGGNKAKEMTDR